MAVVADVFDVLLISKKTNEVIGTTTLQDANIEVSVQESDVRGGKGNQLLGVLHSDRDITINLTDINFRYEWLATQLGQDIVTGAGIAYAMPKWYTVEEVSTDLQIELDHTPSDNGSIAIYDEGGNKLELTIDYTVSGNKVTIIDPTIQEGDQLEVRTYAYQTDPLTQTIEIDNQVFADGVMVILETLEIDETTEMPTHLIQYQFDNALPTGNFSINTSSAREAQTQVFNLRVVKPKNSTKVGKIVRVPYSS
jgi:hypothetical protein